MLQIYTLTGDIDSSLWMAYGTELLEQLCKGILPLGVFNVSRAHLSNGREEPE